jgi:hypothetical protein
MLSRRRLLMLMAAVSLHTPAHAQQILQIGRDSPERKIILDVVRASVERTLGIKAVFVVDRITVFGDWAFASVHPRNEAGNRIDYRRTRIAKDFDPEQDSDHAGALLRRKDAAWSVVEEAFLPTDVYWEEWEIKYKLPRALFLSE